MATKDTLSNPFEDLVWLFDWQYSVQNYLYPSSVGSDYVLSVVPQICKRQYSHPYYKGSVLLNVAILLTNEEDFDVVVCEEFPSPDCFIILFVFRK